jgi:hypothetical protein
MSLTTMRLSEDSLIEASRGGDEYEYEKPSAMLAGKGET